MDTFGLSIAALSLIVAPGVLFIVSFFGSRPVKRSSISFGPAIDIAVFSALSLLINALYGGFVGDIAAHMFHLLHQPPLLPELYSMIGQYADAKSATGMSTQLSVFFFFIFYLFCITVGSVILGNCTAYWFDRFGLSFVNDAFTSIGRTKRRGALTICSVLCKFGEGGAFVIYRGVLDEIVLTGDNAISQILIRQVARALLRIDAGSVYIPANVTHTDPINIAGFGDEAKLVLPGDSIENLALDPLILARKRSACENFWRWLLVVIRALIIVVPIIWSLFIYCSLAAHRSGGPIPAPFPGPGPSPTDLSNIENILASQIKLNDGILKDLAAISNNSKEHQAPSNPPPDGSGKIFELFFAVGANQPEDIQPILDAADACRGGNVEVSGYADSKGSPVYNLGLSLLRAQTVASELRAYSNKRCAHISINAYGSAAVAAGSGPGRADEQRRVEIIVY